MIDSGDCAGEPATGGSLAKLLAWRGKLTAGEIVTIGLPMAIALADLHARGRSHGGVSTSAIVFTAVGRPVLVDPGVRAGHPVGEVTAEDDVRALAELLVAALAPGAPPQILTALEGAVTGQPDATDARSLAQRLRTACEPAPVRLIPATGRTLDRQRSRAGHWPRRVPRPPVRVAVALALVCGAVGAGTAWGRSASSGTTAVPQSASPSGMTPPATRTHPSAKPRPGWAAVLHLLDARRAAAFRRTDVALLGDVYAPGSEALSIDSRAVRALADERLHVRGLQLHLVSIGHIVAASRSVVLRVTDTLSAYDVVDGSGRVVRHHRGRGPRTWHVRLVRDRGGWLIRGVVGVGSPR